MDKPILPEDEFRIRGKAFEAELPSAIEERFRTEIVEMDLRGTIYAYTVGSDSMIVEDTLHSVIKALEAEADPEGLVPADLFPNLSGYFFPIEIDGVLYFDTNKMRVQMHRMDALSADKHTVSVVIEFNDDEVQAVSGYDFDLARIAFDEVCNIGIKHGAILLDKLQAATGRSDNGNLRIQFFAHFVFNEEGVYSSRVGVDKENAQIKFRNLISQVMAFGEMIPKYVVTDEEF